MGPQSSNAPNHGSLALRRGTETVCEWDMSREWNEGEESHKGHRESTVGLGRWEKRAQ